MKTKMLLALLISSNVFILPSAQLKPKPSPQQTPTTKRQKQLAKIVERQKQLAEIVKKSLELGKKIDEILSNGKLDFSDKKIAIQELIAEIKKSLTGISDKTLKERSVDSLIKYRNMQPQDIEKMIIVKKIVTMFDRDVANLEDTKPAVMAENLKGGYKKDFDESSDANLLIEFELLPESDRAKIEPFQEEMRNSIKAEDFKAFVNYFKTKKAVMTPSEKDTISKFLEDFALDITPSDKDDIQSILKEYRDLAQARAQKERATLAKAKKSLAELEAMYEKIPAKTKDPRFDIVTAGLKELQIKEAEAKIKAAQEIVDARKAADKARFNKEQQENFDDFLKRTQQHQLEERIF